MSGGRSGVVAGFEPSDDLQFLVKRVVSTDEGQQVLGFRSLVEPRRSLSNLTDVRYSRMPIEHGNEVSCLETKGSVPGSGASESHPHFPLTYDTRSAPSRLLVVLLTRT